MMDDPELAAKITKFRCLIDEYEVVAYSDIVDYIEQDDTWDGVWKFKEILDHKIVKANDKDYRGSRFNLKMLWETGEMLGNRSLERTRPESTTLRHGCYLRS
jgi:hypothetical protein